MLRVYQDIYRQTGVLAPELEQLPSLPSITKHIWGWFCDLGRTRDVSFSAQAITWRETLAYFTLIGVRPEHWELEALVRLDAAFMDSRSATDAVKSATAMGKVNKNG
jgi:hypothetical protein